MHSRQKASDLVTCTLSCAPGARLRGLVLGLADTEKLAEPNPEPQLLLVIQGTLLVAVGRGPAPASSAASIAESSSRPAASM
jgi:hypothetical protein